MRALAPHFRDLLRLDTTLETYRRSPRDRSSWRDHFGIIFLACCGLYLLIERMDSEFRASWRTRADNLSGQRHDWEPRLNWL